MRSKMRTSPKTPPCTDLCTVVTQTRTQMSIAKKKIRIHKRYSPTKSEASNRKVRRDAWQGTTHKVKTKINIFLHLQNDQFKNLTEQKAA
jgi:hypothetical protein